MGLDTAEEKIGEPKYESEQLSIVQHGKTKTKTKTKKRKSHKRR